MDIRYSCCNLTVYHPAPVELVGEKLPPFEPFASDVTAETSSIPPAATAAPVPAPQIAIPGLAYADGAYWVPAGLGPRLVAFVIDGILLVIVHQLALTLAGLHQPTSAQIMETLGNAAASFFSGGSSAGATAGFMELQSSMRAAGMLNLLICMCYFTIMHGMVGATIGKLCLRLQVRRQDGRTLGLWQALVRYLAYLLSAKVVYGFWTIPFDGQKRALHDYVANSNVFRRVA